MVAAISGRYFVNAREALPSTAAQDDAAAARLWLACDSLNVVDFPADAIIKTAKEKGCDLIVMASHGRRGLTGLMLGSQAQRVVTLGTQPVLICR